MTTDEQRWQPVYYLCYMQSGKWHLTSDKSTTLCGIPGAHVASGSGKVDPIIATDAWMADLHMCKNCKIAKAKILRHAPIQDVL